MASRREFLYGAAGALGAGGTLWRANAARAAADADLAPNAVRLRPEIEPVVQWIENTPRDQIIDVAANHLAKGLPYRELVAGLFLAGIRNVQPRPVGFNFHAVMVVSAMHQISLDSAPADRFYPFFWGLDYFKRSQEQDESKGDWTLGAPNEASLPSRAEAGGLFEHAMETGDAEAADAAITTLARTAGESEIQERLWLHASRNFRNIGHNPIFTAHAFRTLDTIGWRHSEPVLRSLVFGLLGGEADEWLAAPFPANRERAANVRSDWNLLGGDERVALETLGLMRKSEPDQIGAEIAALLERGAGAEDIWDGIKLGAGEILMRRPGVISLHSVTSSNSMHYAFRASGNPRTRLLLLLQGATFTVLFRKEFERRRGPGLSKDGPWIDEIAEAAEGLKIENAGEVYEQMTDDRTGASAAAFALCRDAAGARRFRNAGRELVLHKGDEVHDFKYCAAAFEDYHHASPAWRPHLMASGAYYLKGAGAKDGRLREKTEAALTRLAKA